MIRTCDECGEAYDDARRWTICPHRDLLPEQDMNRKIKAIEIFDSRKSYRVKGTQIVGEITSVDAVGMVTLQGQPWLDLFDPFDLEEV